MKPKTKKKWPYFGGFEVVIHNSPKDCWVSLLGKVFNVTPIIKKNCHYPSIKPLLAMAGKDISDWFDEKTGDVRYFIHPETGNRVPYCPHGRFPDIQVQVPATCWRPQDRLPWWMDETYQVGLLTKRVRPLKVINMLIGKEVTINVCCEDDFFQIQERYRMFCSNIESYTWRYIDKLIIMDKTLEENGIPDERDLFGCLGLPQNFYTPCVFIYYKDDLKNFEYFESSDEAED